jgi:hypothetical protein
LKFVFLFLIVLSLVIRGLIFDKDTRNLMKLVSSFSSGDLMVFFRRVSTRIWVS